ncbi:hypothetical protein Tco_1269330, partial [Tanacetum coccineum]
KKGKRWWWCAAAEPRLVEAVGVTMVVWCSVVIECEGGDDDEGGTVVMGTESGGGVGDGCG